MAYAVLAPAVGVKVAGKTTIAYQGAVLPAADVADAERLIAAGALVDLSAVAEAPAEPVVAVTDKEPAPAAVAPDAPMQPVSAIPARKGPGSSAHAWGQYAASVGVEVPEGADRAAIIEALAAAGKPTE